jgi:hypothetical protein
VRNPFGSAAVFFKKHVSLLNLNHIIVGIIDLHNSVYFPESESVFSLIDANQVFFVRLLRQSA